MATNYIDLHTPKNDDTSSEHSNSTQKSSVPLRSHIAWVLLHWFVGLLLLLATLTPFVYMIPVYGKEISPEINSWWNVNPKIRGSGHGEMSMPTYFFLGMVLPLLIGGLLFPIIRAHSPVVTTPLTHFLHRKPKLFRCLVSYGEILFLIVLIGGNILVFYYQFGKRFRPNRTYDQILSIIALTFGFVGLFNMAFLALPATRHCFWMEWLNIPYAHGIKYHRWISIVAIVTLLGHTFFYVAVYARQNALDEFLPCFNCNIAKEGFDHWMNFFGILSMLAMVIMGFTSLPFFRRKYYSIFYATHFLFIPAALFAVLHWGPVLYWLYATMVIYLVNRMYSSASISTPVTIAKAVAMPSEVVELTLHCATGYGPGDVVWLKVPHLSNTQWHPFSVASTPVHTPGLLTVYVKCLGKWSNALYDYVRRCQALNVAPIVYMDGGYTPAAPIPSKHSHVVFVGGGVGVTPLMGQLVHILHTHPEQHVWLVWHVRQVDMLYQFQAWLHEVEALAESSGGRLHLRLFVTQTQATTIEMDGYKALDDDNDFVAKHTAIQTQPYAHLSTTKRMVVLFFAFACSGGLLAAVKYGNKITAINPQYWPLQRFVEFCLVVVGCYVAYVITYVAKKAPESIAATESDVPKKTLDISAFNDHFKVQFGRANWSNLFEEVANHTDAADSIGVYVSGPKGLIRAVDFELQSKSKFHVHNEEFDM